MKYYMKHKGMCMSQNKANIKISLYLLLSNSRINNNHSKMTLQAYIVTVVESEIKFKSRNKMLTADDMADMRLQGIMVDDDNYKDLWKIPESTKNHNQHQNNC